MTIKKRIFRQGGSLKMTVDSMISDTLGGLRDGDTVSFCKVDGGFVMRRKPKEAGERGQKVSVTASGSMSITIPAMMASGLEPGLYMAEIAGNEVRIVAGSREWKDGKKEFYEVRVPLSMMAAIGCTGGDDVDIIPVPGGIMIRKRDSGGWALDTSE